MSFGNLIVAALPIAALCLFIWRMNRQSRLLGQPDEARGVRVDVPRMTPPNTEESQSSTESRKITRPGANFQQVDITNFDSCRSKLVIQVATDDMLAITKDNLVTWPLAEGLTFMLSADLPGGEITVRAKDAGNWPVSHEHLFELGLKQAATRAANGSLVEFDAMDDDQTLWFGLKSCNVSYIGALLLAMLRAEDGQCVFGLPNWSTAMVRDVDESLTMDKVERMAERVRAEFNSSDRPAAAHLFWHGHGQFKRVEFAPSTEHQMPQLTGPPELLAQLQRVP